MPPGVYVIENLVNGHRYVGSAVDLRQRWYAHLHRLRNGKDCSCHLQNAFRKYGEGAFRFRPLLICNRKNAVLFEQRALDVLRPEYNISPTAGSALGRKHTTEARAKISNSLMGNKHTLGFKPSPETRAKLSVVRTGKKRSAEICAKMSARAIAAHWTRSAETRARSSLAHMNHPTSPETRAKLSAAGSGRKATPEAKANISAGLMGHEVTFETRAKLSARMKGRMLSPEHRAKIGVASKGNKYVLGKHWHLTPETREKMSAAMKLSWAERRKLEGLNV